MDRIRVVTDAGQNFRLEPEHGRGRRRRRPAIGRLQMDGPINGATTTVDAAAYTNNQQNATVTTLYTLDAASDQLYIQNPPNGGTQTTPLAGHPERVAARLHRRQRLRHPAGRERGGEQRRGDGLGFAVLTVGGTTACTPST